VFITVSLVGEFVDGMNVGACAGRIPNTQFGKRLNAAEHAQYDILYVFLSVCMSAVCLSQLMLYIYSGK